MKEKSKNQNVTYSYSEVIKSVEDGINLWDFAIKFGILNLKKNNIFDLLLICTGNDEKKANELFEILSSNSKNYAKENVNQKEVLNYNTLIHLIKKGYTRIEIMKRFGRTSYAGLSSTITAIYKKENISEENRKKITNLLKKNTKSLKVIFVADSNDTMSELSDVETTLDKEETVLPKESASTALVNSSNIITLPESQKYSDKLVLYTIEYLKQQDADIESELFDGICEERVILSCTLTKYLKDQSISDENKIKLTEAVNKKIVNVLQAASDYSAGPQNDKMSVENDIILSEALMLKRHTDKKICIATCNSQTTLNSLTLGFEVRIPKNMLSPNFSDITIANINTISNYFDYSIQTYDSAMSNCNNNSVVILDTCVILNGGDTHSDKILSDTTQLKIIPRTVLNELCSKKLGENKNFFSTLFTAKFNSTIIIDLNMKLDYIFADMAILNFAMYYQLTTGKEVTILTHDFTFYMEALKYNMKVKYYPSTYIDTFSSDEINESEDILEAPQEVVEDYISYYKTISIPKISSKPVIFSNGRIDNVKSGQTLESIALKGNKGYKYYPVELGDYVYFKNDPNIYQIIALTGKNNIKSVDPSKLIPYA